MSRIEPRDHAFVSHPDPRFGGTFGGSCAERVDGVTCGWPQRFHRIDWEPATEERYCVDSGRPVQLTPGDRCLRHGNQDVMCTTAVRDPRCKHPRLSRNHPYPKCEECGRSGRFADSQVATGGERRG